MTRRNTLTAHLLLLAVVLVWGTTFSLVKAALADVSPLLFNLLRMTMAFVVLLAVNHRSLRGLRRHDLGLGAVAGVFLGLGYQFQTAGLARTTAAKSAFLTGLVVVFVPLLSRLPGVSRGGAGKPMSAAGRPTFDVYAGALLALAGVVLLTTPPGTGSQIFAGIGPGEVLTLLCAVAFAAHLLTLARAAPTQTSDLPSSLLAARRLGTLQIGFAALIMLLTLPLGGALRFHSAAIVWIALAITALLATAAAFTIQSWAQQHIAASHTALILTLEPVFAWLTSLLFFGETLRGRALLGAGLILCGILLSELRPTSQQRAPLLPGAGA
jgi:drug/metabolite transporter (DMT)-like permease